MRRISFPLTHVSLLFVPLFFLAKTACGRQLTSSPAARPQASGGKREKVRTCRESFALPALVRHICLFCGTTSRPAKFPALSNFPPRGSPRGLNEGPPRVHPLPLHHSLFRTRPLTRVQWNLRSGLDAAGPSVAGVENRMAHAAHAIKYTPKGPAHATQLPSTS